MSRRLPLVPDSGGTGGPVQPMTPLQAELLEEGRLPEPDALGAELLRPDVAPEAGYAGEGPSPLEGPGGTVAGDPDRDRYSGRLRVLQWEVDPRRSDLPAGEADVETAGWDYALWWQEHPVGLVYVSMQAVRADEADHFGTARPHPVGRSVTVNLVYDDRRGAVVAIYGTARDFRPFVEAFREGYGLTQRPDPGASNPPTGEVAEDPAKREPDPEEPDV